MFPVDVSPNAPQPFMIAQLEQAKESPEKVRAIGYCDPVANLTGNHDPYESTSPSMLAKVYFEDYENKKVDGVAIVTILEQPKYGVLVPTKSGRSYIYTPNEGYYGKDQATYLVEIAGYKVKVVQFIKVIATNTFGNDGVERNCSDTGTSWKISSLPTGTDSTTITYSNLINSAVIRTGVSVKFKS